MEAFLAQLAAAARKASDPGYSTQGRPPVQRKSAPAGRPLKRGVARQRSPSAPARKQARKSHVESNTHKHKTLDWHAAPNSAIRAAGPDADAPSPASVGHAGPRCRPNPNGPGELTGREGV